MWNEDDYAARRNEAILGVCEFPAMPAQIPNATTVAVFRELREGIDGEVSQH
jgi:hypothetical protein